jgi:hypothetical protein
LTFEINVVKSAQSSMTANAVQTTAPVITARITKALTTTATLTASVLDLDIASANLTSSFTLRANANRWYPRPNGYWDTSIEYQQPWANWNRLRIHNLNVNTVGTLIDFGGYIKLTSDGTNISLNGATGFNPTLTYYDVDIFNGSSLILKNPNTGTNEYVLAVDSFNGTKSKTYNSSIPSTADFYWNHTYRVLYNTTNTTWRAICSILGYTLIYRASASGGDVVFLLVESFNSGTGVWSGALGYSYSFTNVVTGPLNYGPNFTFVMTRVNSSTSFTISSDYNNETITHSVSEINDNSGTISAGSYYAYNIPNSGYLTVTSAASDVLLTTSDFNESYIVSTYPYILNDQTGVLGLYDTYGALDRTGLVGQAQAALTSSTTQAINANKLISMSASLSGTFTQVSTVKKIARTPIAVQSTATISPTGARIRFGATALSTTATVSLTAKKYNGFVVNQSSQATVNAVPYDFTKAQAALQVQTSIDPTALRIKQIAADFTAFYSEVTAAFKNATGTILMESTATITCDARKITDSPQYMFVNANLTAQGINTLFGSSSLSSTTAFSLTPTYLRRNESAMSVSTSLVANNVRTRGLSSTQSSQFYQFAYTETSKIVGYASTMLSASALVANNQILRLAQADLASEFTTPYIYAGVLVRIEADLQVNAFTLTAGRVINIDPYYQLLIARETRTLEVHRENRVIRVNSETRVNKIKGYPTI